MPEEQNSIQTISAELSSPMELFKKSFELYKTGFKKFIGMMLMPVLGAVPLIVVLLLFALFSFVLKNNDMARNIINVILGLAGIISVAFIIIVAVISQTGLYILVRDAAKNLTIKQAFLDAKKVAWKFFIVSFATGIFAMLWALLFVIPGIWAAINYSFALWVFLYEGVSGTGALKRSKELVKGNWWGVLGRLFVIYFLFWLIVAVPAIIITAITDSKLISDIWGIISNIISFLLTPLAIIYTCYLYWDVKKVKGESK